MTKSVQIKGAGENGPIAEVDDFTGFMVNLDAVHHRVHNGEMFQVDLVDLVLADDGVLAMLVTVPEGGSAHMRFAAQAGGDAHIELFENPTVTVVGSAAAEVNRNRRSALTADVVVTTGPTTTADGTALASLVIGGGSGGNSAGGGVDSFEEWVLKADEQYLFRVTNVAGGIKPVGIAIDWYEPGLT